jgi:diaminopimelate decarboxylase
MQLINNQYQIQGLNVLDICKEYDTPIYIYDGDKILSQFNILKTAFSGLNVKIKYAAKALTNQAILKLLRKAGSGIDVVSIQEHLKLCLLQIVWPLRKLRKPSSWELL